MKKKSHQLFDLNKAKYAARELKMVSSKSTFCIINHLIENGALSCIQISDNLNFSQNNINRQLATLFEHGLLNRAHQNHRDLFSINFANLEKIIKISENLYYK